ncbi:hypothetical protein [Ruegeria sp. HKCCD8929]|uniref:hypothetical protein n=1 Tax=Ruegeria sp. HKCCD8929 TaxID=2683006 RepID=UPI001489F3FD|nr:hypothetical protein [Ruegeria sp. HKCCD8929]
MIVWKLIEWLMTGICIGFAGFLGWVGIEVVRAGVLEGIPARDVWLFGLTWTTCFSAVVVEGALQVYSLKRWPMPYAADPENASDG